MAKPFAHMFTFFTALIFLPILDTTAQSTRTIAVGQSLSASTNGSSWLSSSGDFAFGFHQLTNDSSLFLLAIWYAKIFDTVVWYANDGHPVQEGSKVTLTADKGLVLSDPQGTSLIWSTSDELSTHDGVSYGIMSDTGNFVLKNSSNKDLWQSFDHPTDTLLPAQFMQINGEVHSRLSETNFTRGRFQLRLTPEGNLVLNTRDTVSGNPYGAYYTSGAAQNKTNPGKEYYQRATLNFDGVLMWYSIPKTSISNGWSMVQAIPDNICTSIGASGPQLGSGICGFNSICILGDDKRPTCKCPPDVCKEHAELSIKDDFRLECFPSTNWPFSDYEKLDPYNEDDCKITCLNDCFCAAVVFENGSTPVCFLLC